VDRMFSYVSTYVAQYVTTDMSVLLWTMCNSVEGVIHVHVRLYRGNVTCTSLYAEGW
jgi:hypothetical protein